MAYDFNGESGNKNTSSKLLKRLEFEFKDNTFKFLLNPETYEQVETSRMKVTHTKAGAFIEAFGANIIEINISGITGLKNGSEDTDNGYTQFKKLRDLIKSVYDDVEDGKEITDFMNFYNFTDNEYYVVYPEKFQLSRSKTQPLLYKYSIHLYCIRRIGEPEQKVTISAQGSGDEEPPETPVVENTIKPMELEEVKTSTNVETKPEVKDEPKTPEVSNLRFLTEGFGHH